MTDFTPEYAMQLLQAAMIAGAIVGVMLSAIARINRR